MSLRRRKALVRLAREYYALIVMDDVSINPFGLPFAMMAFPEFHPAVCYSVLGDDAKIVYRLGIMFLRFVEEIAVRSGRIISSTFSTCSSTFSSTLSSTFSTAFSFSFPSTCSVSITLSSVFSLTNSASGSTISSPLGAS